MTSSPQSTQPIPDYAPPAKQSLGRATARGFVWMLAQMLAGKAMAMGGQIVLAWLLVPRDFGLVGLAYTATALAALIQYAGLREVLIQRRAKFDRWANAVFWMSLARGLVSLLLMLAIAPIAARLFHEPRLFGLIVVLALAGPFQAASIVPLARLQADLRFALSAVLTFASGLFSTALSILLAWRGYGAYSFVLPTLAAAVVQSAILWCLAPSPVRRSLQLRRWRLLLGDSGLALGAVFLGTAVMYGDNFILGLVRSAEEVGIYYFAYNLSIQTVVVLVGNLSQVLLPGLSHIQNDAQRQIAACLRATRVLVMLGIPLCFLQAAVADPLIHILYAPKWYPAILPLQVLSVGLALGMISGPVNNLLIAMGRFGLYLLLAALNAVVFFGLVVAGATQGGVIGVSVAVLVFSFVVGPFCLYAVVRLGNGGVRHVVELVAIPLACSSAAMAAAAGLAWLVPHIQGQHWIRLGVTLTTGPLLYIGIIHLIAPGRLLELMGLWRQVASRA